MLKQILTKKISTTVQETFDQKVEAQVEYPSSEEHGDYSTNTAMLLAGKLKRNPLEIAEELVEKLSEIPGISKIEVVKPGFINFFIDYSWLAANTSADQGKAVSSDTKKDGTKYIIEHTAVNPNKAMHIGHLRNAFIGDTIARLLRLTGHHVETQNYIDDTGKQVSDTITALLHLGKKQPKDQPFDEFCWDLYAEINQKLLEDEKLVQKQKEIAHELEVPGSETADYAHEFVQKIVQKHLETVAQFEIYYDLLTHESDILRHGFWDQAFEALKKSDKFVLQKSGKQKDCWVLKYGGEEGDKIFVRSDGHTVYTAKDVAYHMWKFGLFQKDFDYCVWPGKVPGQTEKTLLKTCSGKEAEKSKIAQAEVRKHISPNKNVKVINVIDFRQVYPQKMVQLALKTLGYKKEAESFLHIDYGTVGLSKNTVKKLGLDVSEDKTSYSMSGRKGLGVKANDLLKLLISEVDKEKGAKPSNKQVAIGAIRHYMLKYNARTDINFDYQDALNLYGDTGPYLQYSFARACGILRKAQKDNKAQVGSEGPEFDPGMTAELKFSDSEKKLLKLCVTWPEVLETVSKSLEISLLSEFALKLASAFHGFYEENQVLKAKDHEKAFRIFLLGFYKEVMAEVLGVLGIPALEKM